ncbi:MAG: 1-acyl-sn-glycerol-3-phosphate acyltransferase [Candidatus Saccharibacteria bacterium]|nr:1-acyl-sn-glycerol-3-phosphate acyltransferase [Candidatus Saccharibacteria bacterium]
MAKAVLFQGDLPKEERVFYYTSEEDDPIKTKEQEKKQKVLLPEGYEFIPKNPFVKLYSAVLFRGFKVFARFYARFYLHMKIVGREKLKKAKGKGYVIYANHTNPFHDAFSPALVADRRIFTIISPVNLKLPGIGKFLPYIGGMPLGTNEAEKKAFNEAVDKRLKQKNCLVIYPEAHVWPYHTEIRKFPAGDKSFKYAARNNLPIFTMTTTYHKSKVKGQERPDMTVYVDGPFYAKNGSDDEKRAEMAEWAEKSLKKFAKKSSYKYFEYKKKEAK